MKSTPSMLTRRLRLLLLLLTGIAAPPFPAPGQQPAASAEQTYTTRIRPILEKYCYECHDANEPEAEINLEGFQTLSHLRQATEIWERVDAIVASSQMPPKKSDQPTDAERLTLLNWTQEFLTAEALAHAGDPGQVTLRRLSNSEYTHTLRDLTGIESLDPAREFPVDGAAGEGFSNTGDALVMSPALVTKYLDAAKEIAAHAVFLPGGFRFSPHTTRRDWTDQWLGEIRQLYDIYSDPGGGSKVTLQGLTFETDQGGRLPLAAYLRATLTEREALLAGTRTIEEAARKHSLSPKYLRQLWTTLTQERTTPSPLLDRLRDQWRRTQPGHAEELVKAVEPWQTQLWTHNGVGHIGTATAASSWLSPLTPIVPRQEIRLKLPDSPAGTDILIHLAVDDAGDGNEQDFVEWINPRLEGGSGPPIPLWAVAGLKEQIERATNRMLDQTPAYLAAASAASHENAGLTAIAKEHGLDASLLTAWMDYLDLRYSGPVTVSGHYTETMSKAGNYDFIKGWGSPSTPSISANSSDQEVRIPGISRPHSVVVHPSPTLFTAVGWSSPFDGVVRVEARLADAHSDCGNGIEWFLQHQSGRRIGNLWQGEFEKGGNAVMRPETLPVRKHELITLLVGPRKAEHFCDLTEIQLVITETGEPGRVWDLAADVSPNILQSNPHPDTHGHAKVWHFYRGEMSAINKTRSPITTVPAGSLLAQWQADPANRTSLAGQIKTLVTGAPPADSNSADGILHRQIRALATPADPGTLIKEIAKDPRFGKHPLGHPLEPGQLVSHAPGVMSFRIASELARGREFLVTAQPEAGHASGATLQVHVSTSLPNLQGISPAAPIIAADDSPARERVERFLGEFRDLFPPTVCYHRIVPIDEVVTLNLFYREDDQLQRLMLEEEEIARLDRLWDEFFFISQEPLAKVGVFEQLSEFATQDAPQMVIALKPLGPVIEANAQRFQQKLTNAEPVQLQAVLDFAGRAWRRPLAAPERNELQSLYQSLRQSGIPHEGSARLVLARILTSPAFLYRLETPAPGNQAAPVTGLELASRLSYFLWSSQPDAELRTAAESGTLTGEHTLLAQTRRMLGDARIRRLAVEFGCQWLHIRNFDQNDEKNENLYPEFATLRIDMYEESIRFFEDLFRNNGSLRDLLDADHAFLNQALARHYGIDGVPDDQWLKVSNVQKHNRGGILGMASVLASLSGASRTSPILRGNWIYETLLGQHLPNPPAGVPILPPAVPEGLTARELIEKHSSAPECAGCHSRIDPYGFALEQFDAIGRLRPTPANTLTSLRTGEEIDGLPGLRAYLLNQRWDDILHQFCKKLLGYSLGRATQLSDRPLLDEMKRRLKAADYRFHTAVETIVTSPQFLQIRGQELQN